MDKFLKFAFASLSLFASSAAFAGYNVFSPKSWIDPTYDLNPMNRVKPGYVPSRAYDDLRRQQAFADLYFRQQLDGKEVALAIARRTGATAVGSISPGYNNVFSELTLFRGNVAKFRFTKGDRSYTASCRYEKRGSEPPSVKSSAHCYVWAEHGLRKWIWLSEAQKRAIGFEFKDVHADDAEASRAINQAAPADIPVGINAESNNKPATQDRDPTGREPAPARAHATGVDPLE